MTATDRCDTARRRSDCSFAETSSQPTAEQNEAVTQNARHDAEREAEARRNAYFSSSTDVGGQSRAASSDARSFAQQSDDDPKLRASRYTASIDHPLQDDPIGNAIPGVIVSGLAGGPRAAMRHPTGILERTVLEHMAEHTGKSLGTSVAKIAAKQTALRAAFIAQEKLATPKDNGTTTQPNAAAEPRATVPAAAATAGQSSSRATSEPAPEPNHSEAPEAPIGRDRAPYAPGAAPVRVPELPVETSQPHIIRG